MNVSRRGVGSRAERHGGRRHREKLAPGKGGGSNAWGCGEHGHAVIPDLKYNAHYHFAARAIDDWQNLSDPMTLGVDIAGQPANGVFLSDLDWVSATSEKPEPTKEHPATSEKGVPANDTNTAGRPLILADSIFSAHDRPRSVPLTIREGPLRLQDGDDHLFAEETIQALRVQYRIRLSDRRAGEWRGGFLRLHRRRGNV